MVNLEKIKKDFIIDGDMEMENVENFIERVSKFSRVDKAGHVVIKEEELKKILPIKEKILLVIMTRFLANKLQEKLEEEPTISQNIDASELSNILGIKKDVVSARLKEIKDERKILLQKRGTFSMAPYYIETFLSKLENRGNKK